MAVQLSEVETRLSSMDDRLTGVETETHRSRHRDYVAIGIALGLGLLSIVVAVILSLIFAK
jgi:hypothetical protein